MAAGAITDDDADVMRAQLSGETVLEVWPENVDAVLVFFAVATQWKYAGMSGQRTGLDYPAVRLACAAHAPGSPWRDVFLRVQVLERETLALDQD